MLEIHCCHTVQSREGSLQISLYFRLEKKKQHFVVIFSMTFQFFFLGKLSAITYSVPEGINYSLELIVRISYSELLDVVSALDRARGHMAFLFPSFFLYSVLSVRLLV